MHNKNQSPSQNFLPLPLEDFGKLQERYQSLTLSHRAKAVLTDAEPALKIAEELLTLLAANHDIKQIFTKIRKNSILIGKMRPSDARNLLVDGSSDFIAGTLHKLAAWRKTMERLSQGEGIVCENERETISTDAPLSLAIIGTSGLSNYVSVIQLALAELSKGDKKSAVDYRDTIAEMRRCATILSDCESASGITSLVNK